MRKIAEKNFFTAISFFFNEESHSSYTKIDSHFAKKLFFLEKN